MKHRLRSTAYSIWHMGGICVAILLIVIAAQLNAQQIVQDEEIKRSVLSGVDFHATNTGIFGYDKDGSKTGFTSPRNGGVAYLFGSGVWFGARKRVTDTLRKLVFLTYNPVASVSWAAPGEWNGNPQAAPADLYHSVDYDLFSGIAKTQDGSRPNWPLWLYPGEFSYPMYAGRYEILDRNRTDLSSQYSRPAFMPEVDEEFVARFHDNDLERYEIQSSIARERGYPIGLQCQQVIYSWQSGRYEQTVVLQYQFINMSSDTLFDCVVGNALDPDLGDQSDDRVSYYPARPDLRAGYIWTLNEMENTYGTMTVIILEGPMVNTKGFIDNKKRWEYKHYGRVGTFKNWTTETTPKTSAERYDFMSDGQHDGDDGPGEKKAMIATERFSMLPGDTAHFAVAYAVLPGTPGSAHGDGGGTGSGGFQKYSITPRDSDGTTKVRPYDIIEGRTISNFTGTNGVLETHAETLMDDYYGQGYFGSVISGSTGQPNLDGIPSGIRVGPNPATDEIIANLQLSLPSGVRLRFYNSMGQITLDEDLGMLGAGAYMKRIDVSEMAAGAYVVMIEGDFGSYIDRLIVTH